MNAFPIFKEYTEHEGFCSNCSFDWHFAENTDERVVAAAKRISSEKGETSVYISHGGSNSEGYSLTVRENEIEIKSEGAAGAFYALATLKMLMTAGKGKIKCCEINDAPDMPYRGFYQDVTRGRIPTLDTLKKLVDTMADYKLNSLQLYIEHTYEFKEYDFCRELGYLTKAEIQELDGYCRERFVELVPSLSCFGHLYHLLQSDKYKHLCELKDYQPTIHYFYERMAHHTINPLLDESFELITSLIDQHLEAFTSDKFNMCCDETFDLGKDVNSGKDKGELYIGFVKKLANYIKSKGKTVMMWGDIVLKYPEKISELPDDIIFLNWGYDAEVNEESAITFANKRQIVCPGTTTWKGFHEKVYIEESNIINFVKLGKKYNAFGMLNTNWGDIGNPASIDMAMYGLILGAAVSWNVSTELTKEFKDFVSEYHYGTAEALEILTEMCEAAKQASWPILIFDYKENTKEAFEASIKAFDGLIERIKRADFKTPELLQEFLIAAQGESLATQWSAARAGHKVESTVAFEDWLSEYKKNWLEDSKPSELEELAKMLTEENTLSRGI